MLSPIHLRYGILREKGVHVFMKALELPELDILAHCIQGASSGSTWSKDHPGWISTDCLVLGKQHVDFRSLDPACLSPTLSLTPL